MATYVNDLRLKEIATGDESGTWGTSTNTNLELIAEKFGSGSEALSDASTATITMADGTSDAFRSLALTLTGSLSQACTVTLAPNTLSNVWMIKNSAGDAVTLTQGTGANVVIPNGFTKVVYSDGAGAGAAVVDVFDDLSIGPNLRVGNAAAEDTSIVFDGNAKDFYVGLDDSADKLVIGEGSTVGTNNILTITDDTVTIGDGAAADTAIVFDGNAQDFYIGLDDSADDLIIGLGSTVGTTPIISVDENKDVAIPDGSLTITTADNTTQLTLTSTDDDASVGPRMDFRRDSSSPAADDDLGAIRFMGEDDGSTALSYANITTQIEDPTDGAEDGKFKIETRMAGSMRNRLTMDSTSTIFNQDSLDVDLRVESDGDAHCLFVDGGNNAVGIGTGTPTSPNSVNRFLHIHNADHSSLVMSDDQNTWEIVSNNNLTVRDGTDTRLTVDTSGRVLIGTDSGDAFNADSMLKIGRAGDRAFLQFKTDADQVSGILFGDVDDDVECSIEYEPANKALTFSTDNNTEAGRFDSSQRLLIGSTAAQSVTGGARQFEIQGTTGVAASMAIIRHSNSTGGATISLGKSRATSAGGVTIAADGDVIGELRFAAADGVDIDGVSANIKATVDGTPGTNDIPGRLSFWTTADGAAAETQRMFIDAGGHVVINPQTGGNIDSLLNGNLNIVTTEGAQSFNAIQLFYEHESASANLEQRIAWFFGDDGTAHSYGQSGYIALGKQDVYVTSGNRDSYMSFATQLDGTTSEKMRVTSRGQLVIANTAAHSNSTLLHLEGGSSSSATPIAYFADGDGSVEGGSTILQLAFDGDDTFSSANYVFFSDSGGTQGEIRGTGDGTVTYDTTSDQRLKDNIRDTDSKWDMINAIQVRDFEWKRSGNTNTAFIAQELHSVYPEAAYEGGEDPKTDPWSVNYGRLTPVLTKALQEAMARIETLEAEVSKLKGE